MDLTAHLPPSNPTPAPASGSGGYIPPQNPSSPQSQMPSSAPKKSNMRLIMGVVALLILGVGTASALYLVQQSQDTRQQAAVGTEQTGMCLAIKLYIQDDAGQWVASSWGELSGKVELNDTIRFAASGTANKFQKARFRVNSGEWQESTTKNQQGEWYYDYQVTTKGNFGVEAELLEI